MKVYSRCKSCLSDIEFSSKAKTRIDFVMQHDEFVSIRCNNCQNKNNVHVDEFKAELSKISQIIAGFIFLLGTAFLLYFVMRLYLSQVSFRYMVLFSFSLLIPILIYNRINSEDQRRVRAFNRFKYRQ